MREKVSAPNRRAGDYILATGKLAIETFHGHLIPLNCFAGWLWPASYFVMHTVWISHLYISPAHNYFGRHGQEAGTAETIERSAIRCVEARGVEGDRFFDYKPNYKGQITFFDEAVYLRLCADFGVRDKQPDVFRRNVILGGVDLNDLIGKDFSLQGVEFRGMAECKPCYWMDGAFHPGAEEKLRGFGGLRAQILTTGTLAVAKNLTLRWCDRAAASEPTLL